MDEFIKFFGFFVDVFTSFFAVGAFLYRGDLKKIWQRLLQVTKQQESGSEITVRIIDPYKDSIEKIKKQLGEKKYNELEKNLRDISSGLVIKRQDISKLL